MIVIYIQNRNKIMQVKEDIPKIAAKTAGKTAAAKEIPGKSAAAREMSGNTAAKPEIPGKIVAKAEMPGKIVAKAEMPGKIVAKAEMFVRKSLGIILVHQDQKRVLLIKKRYTYEYDAFLHGRYDISCPERITKLLGGMTLEEKLIIKTRNFSFMWMHKHLYLGTPPSIHYTRGLAKFAASFGSDISWNWLVKTINGTSYAISNIYEIPKGRKSGKNEPNIITAIREVEEETSIGPSDYIMVPDIKKTTMHVEEDVRYLAVYYVAIVKSRATPVVNIKSPSQCFETAEMGWYTPEEMKKIRVASPLIKISAEVLKELRAKGR